MQQNIVNLIGRYQLLGMHSFLTQFVEHGNGFVERHIAVIIAMDEQYG